jgi:hypothetical protein
VKGATCYPVDADVALAAHRTKASMGKLSWSRRMVLSMVGGDFVRDAEHLVEVVADHDAAIPPARAGGIVTRAVRRHQARS